MSCYTPCKGTVSMYFPFPKGVKALEDLDLRIRGETKKNDNALGLYWRPSKKTKWKFP